MRIVSAIRRNCVPEGLFVIFDLPPQRILRILRIRDCYYSALELILQSTFIAKYSRHNQNLFWRTSAKSIYTAKIIDGKKTFLQEARLVCSMWQYLHALPEQHCMPVCFQRLRRE